MSTVVIEETIRIPGDVTDLDSFRRWAHSDAFPDRGRFSYLQGEVWVDMSPEDLYAHNQAKGEVSFAITGLLKTVRLGRFFHDRVLVTNAAAGLSTEPDGTFVSFESLKSGRVELVKGGEGFIEITGTPDMVLEVVSSSFERQDTEVLTRLYYRAGVTEYWLVDVRGKKSRFDILRRGRGKYAATPKRAGWAESSVFGNSSFKLTRQTDELGYPEYALSVR